MKMPEGGAAGRQYPKQATSKLHLMAHVLVFKRLLHFAFTQVPRMLFLFALCTTVAP